MPYNIRAYKTVKAPLTYEQVRSYGYDPVASTQMGTRHLSMLYKKYSGYKDQEKFALMAYNGGESRVNRWLDGEANLPWETINFYNKLKAIQLIIRYDLI